MFSPAVASLDDARTYVKFWYHGIRYRQILFAHRVSCPVHHHHFIFGFFLRSFVQSDRPATVSLILPPSLLDLCSFSPRPLSLLGLARVNADPVGLYSHLHATFRVLLADIPFVALSQAWKDPAHKEEKLLAMASSSDEGEIIENGVEDLKATSLPHVEGSGVDRQDRHRNRHSSPENDAASRHSNSSRRSRSPRGYKRSRDDRDYYANGRQRDHDSRSSRGYYDDYRRSRVSYDDLDRPAPHASNYNHESRDRNRDRSRDSDRYTRDRDRERDRYSSKRPRNRSRSPRSRRADRGRLDRFVREGPYDQRDDSSRGGLRYEDGRSQRNGGSESKRTTVGEASHGTGDDAKRNKGITKDNRPSNSRDHKWVHRHSVQSSRGTDASTRKPAPQTEPEPEPEQDFEEAEPIDEEAEIERRRKRREEILAKSSSATPLLLHAVGAVDKARASSPASSFPSTPLRLQSEVESPRTPRSGKLPATSCMKAHTNGIDVASPHSPHSGDEPFPGGFSLLDDQELMNSHGKVKIDEEDGPSAADYDPTADMKEDELRDELRHGQVVLHGEPHIVETTEKPQEETVEKPVVKASAGGGDGDGDDDFDMFAEDFDEEKYATKPETAPPIEAGSGPAPQTTNKGGILEGDDKDGYYKIRIGEVINGRYQIQSALGKGMFSGVARAIDITTKKPVAIKLMRNNDALRKGGYTEIAILQKLNDADPENRKHIVKFERSFDYNGHLCMVFENLSLNLREVLRKFGNNVGINLGATRAYAYQIFVALAHMRKCSIIHADLKPDNILVR